MQPAEYPAQRRNKVCSYYHALTTMLACKHGSRTRKSSSTSTFVSTYVLPTMLACKHGSSICAFLNIPTSSFLCYALLNASQVGHTWLVNYTSRDAMNVVYDVYIFSSCAAGMSDFRCVRESAVELHKFFVLFRANRTCLSCASMSASNTAVFLLTAGE